MTDLMAKWRCPPGVVPGIPNLAPDPEKAKRDLQWSSGGTSDLDDLRAELLARRILRERGYRVRGTALGVVLSWAFARLFRRPTRWIPLSRSTP